MTEPTNTQLAGYLRGWAKDVEQNEAGRRWLLIAAQRMESPYRMEGADAICPRCTTPFFCPCQGSQT